MAADIRSSELRIVGRDNDTILDLRPLQGLLLDGFSMAVDEVLDAR